jgi:hypothetical protein
MSFDIGSFFSGTGSSSSGSSVVGISTEAARAAAGDPTAIADLAKQGKALGDAEIKALFTAEGVPSSFFSQFPFLKFLDNSTNQWKSRFEQMKSWTANQRLAWYINQINSGKDIQDAKQYSELYGTLHDHIDDTRSVSINLAQTFNNLCDSFFFQGGAIQSVHNGDYVRSQILCDITIASASTFSGELSVPINTTVSNNPVPSTATTSKFSSMGNLLMYGLLIGGLFYLVKQFFSKNTNK